MKRVVSMIAIVGLMLGAVTAADAAKRKKKKKPVKATLYLHGTEAVGEIDMVNNFAASYSPMDTTKPAAGAPKSRQFTTWSGDPAMWNDCAGSYLLPVWSGSVAGRVVGDIKVTLNTISGPKAVTVQIWPDLMSQACGSNDVSQGEYPEPAAEATVDLPPGAGKTEVVLKKVNFKAAGALTMQILPVGPAPGRVLFDSADYASSIAFTCIPARGKRCTS